MSEVSMQTIVGRVEDVIYKVAQARVFHFGEIHEVHRLMAAGAANGKIVVRLSYNWPQSSVADN
jgi:hypothetical protein